MVVICDRVRIGIIKSIDPVIHIPVLHVNKSGKPFSELLLPFGVDVEVRFFRRVIIIFVIRLYATLLRPDDISVMAPVVFRPSSAQSETGGFILILDRINATIE